MPMPCAMGLALECFQKNSPSKRRILKEGIPDNKAFYPCAGARAKSHLKWAEALRIRVVFGIRELLRRFWLLLGFKSNEESKFCFFALHFPIITFR